MHRKLKGLYFGPKESVMSLVSNLVKFNDCSIVWEIVVQFFWAKI